MKRTVALSLLLFGLMSCSLFEEDTPNPDPQNSAPTVTLNASTLSGAAPLSVTFTATASDPDGDTLSYRWSLEGADNASSVSQIFTEAGSYPVSVTVSDGQLEASASTTVTATEPGTDPVPPTDPTTPPPTDPNSDITLSVTASPGGPVPWGVTYEVKADGKIPDGSTLSVTCADQPAIDLAELADSDIEDVFSCIHLATGEGVVSTLKDKNGKVIAQKDQTADVQTSTSVPFGGSWEYEAVVSSFDQSAAFAITQPVDNTTGRGEGDYYINGGGTEPEPADFTMSAEKNRLNFSATLDRIPDFPRDTSLIFVGDYTSAADAAPSQQTFYFFSPDSRGDNAPGEDLSAYGYVYTVQ